MQPTQKQLDAAMEALMRAEHEARKATKAYLKLSDKPSWELPTVDFEWVHGQGYQNLLKAGRAVVDRRNEYDTLLVLSRKGFSGGKKKKTV